MKTSLVSVSAIATLAAAVFFLCVGRPSPSHASTRPATPTTSPEGTKLLGRLPVAFVPNLGQWEHQASYVARFGAMTVFLQDKGWTFTLVERGHSETESVPPMAARARECREPKPAQGRGVAVRMSFVGANTPELAPEQQLPGRHNYFLGNDVSRWRSDVPLYGSVSYRQLYPGVDVCVREQDGHLEYDLMLEPQAQLEPVEVAVEGIERMHVDAEGALVMDTQLGPVRMPAPLTWEDGPSGERSVVTCRYVLRGENRFSFEVSGRRPGWALTVDPGLVWSTFLGGVSVDVATAIALDGQGAATVAGWTRSVDFPTTPGVFDRSYNGGTMYTGDAFVTRLSPTGSNLVYSTFVGGAGSDEADALAVDGQGMTTFAGWTSSSNFPTTSGAFDTTYNGGGSDAFVSQLSPTGSSLVYSTFIGGSGPYGDTANAIAVGLNGETTVVGVTSSTDFPTSSGAFDRSYNGGMWDAFVARFLPSGSGLVYATFLGGARDDFARAVAVDAQGQATVAGHSDASDFPTTPGAFDTSHNGDRDAFVTRLSITGSSLVYSTFVGGTGGEFVTAVGLDGQGAATVAGSTWSTDFPTTPGAFDMSYNGNYDAFVTNLSSSGSILVHSTFLGGMNDDHATAVAVDLRGGAILVGRTNSPDLPTSLGAFDRSYNGGTTSGDAFAARFSPTGSSLVYSTFLGAGADDEATALAIDAQRSVTVVGWTNDSQFPTTPGAFDTSSNGGTDAFVTKLDMLPTGVSAFGRSSPGCNGPLAISVTSMPRVGNAAFALTCDNAAPNTTGLVALAAAGLTTPIPVLGVELWLDPSSAFFLTLSANSDARGACEFGLPIPNQPWFARMRMFAQFVWAGPTSPQPCPPLGLSASNALDITIQP